MMIIVALAMVVGVGTRASDGAVIVTDPEQLMAPNDGTRVRIEMDDDARLMERVLGVDSPVALDGVDDQCFVVFGKSGVGPGGYLVIESDGWGAGVIYKDILSEGSSPDLVAVFLDRDGGGFGEGDWMSFTPYSNVEVWETGLGLVGAGGIEYDDVLDGFTDHVFVLQNPNFFEDLGDVVLVVPEPATIALMGAGLPLLWRRRRRTAR